jgi:Adenine-specific methyltransferase EcoRI
MAIKSAKQKSLGSAKAAKLDEFYTQLADIERELKNYRQHFKGKVVYLNCDDPRESQFFHYFSYNFEKLGLKKLIAACYMSQDVDLFSSGDSAQAIYLEYEGDKNHNRVPDPDEIGIKNFTGDGDFRSAESIKLLEEADIVVTNPPFSLFREYVAQLMEHDKKFIILGNMNAVAYKEVWAYIKSNKLWLGVTRAGTGQMWFRIKDDAPIKTGQRVDENGFRYQTIGNSAWFTNLDHAKRHEELTLFKTYDPENYPSYDNFDAIEVAKAADIPVDYTGVMGVPITFLGRYNPEQFEILGTDESDFPPTTKYKAKSKVVNGVRVPSNTGSGGAYIRAESFGPGTFFDVGYPVKRTYKRIFIRRKDV